MSLTNGIPMSPPQLSARVQWAITHVDGQQCEPVAELIVVVVLESVAMLD